MQKAQAYKRKVANARNEWKANFYRCMGCHRIVMNFEVHEICRKSQAPNRWADVSNYLNLCPTCHAGPFANAPHAFQLAVKLLEDHQHYSLDDWRVIDDPHQQAPRRISQQEIDQYADILRAKR